MLGNRDYNWKRQFVFTGSNRQNISINNKIKTKAVENVCDCPTNETNSQSSSSSSGYKLLNKTELVNAVNLWISNPNIALVQYGDINTWDTSEIIDMSSLFRDKTTFNDDISNWDTSNVTDMSEMFYNANAFNQNITNWNVGNVTNMSYMFYYANDFNQDIRVWDVSLVGEGNFDNMFEGAEEMFNNLGAPSTPTTAYFTI